MLNFIKNRKYLPYFIVLIGYFLILFFAYLLIDRVIFPSITSDRTIVTVPYIQGQDFEEAKRTLGRANLGIEIVKEVYSEKLKTGTIVTQIPAANSKVKSDRAIFVTVSKGQEMEIVPYITGLTLRSARVALMRAGFEVGDVSYDFSEKYQKDTVIRQSQAPGSKKPYGSAIDVVISKGSENQTKIPSLIGLTLNEAKSAITESGFIVGDIRRQASETYLPDLVIEQNPKAGENAVTGTIINLIVTQ